MDSEDEELAMLCILVDRIKKNYQKKIWVREIFARREQKAVTFNNLVAE